jgi:hypothetical protein
MNTPRRARVAQDGTISGQKEGKKGEEGKARKEDATI